MAFVRRVDELGRIVVPREIRDTLGINPGDQVDLFVDEHKIVLAQERA